MTVYLYDNKRYSNLELLFKHIAQTTDFTEDQLLYRWYGMGLRFDTGLLEKGDVVQLYTPSGYVLDPRMTFLDITSYKPESKEFFSTLKKFSLVQRNELIRRWKNNLRTPQTLLSEDLPLAKKVVKHPDKYSVAGIASWGNFDYKRVSYKTLTAMAKAIAHDTGFHPDTIKQRWLKGRRGKDLIAPDLNLVNLRSQANINEAYEVIGLHYYSMEEMFRDLSYKTGLSTGKITSRWQAGVRDAVKLTASRTIKEKEYAEKLKLQTSNNLKQSKLTSKSVTDTNNNIPLTPDSKPAPKTKTPLAKSTKNKAKQSSDTTKPHQHRPKLQSENRSQPDQNGNYLGIRSNLTANEILANTDYITQLANKFNLSVKETINRLNQINNKIPTRSRMVDQFEDRSVGMIYDWNGRTYSILHALYSDLANFYSLQIETVRLALGVLEYRPDQLTPEVLKRLDRYEEGKITIDGLEYSSLKDLIIALTHNYPYVNQLSIWNNFFLIKDTVEELIKTNLVTAKTFDPSYQRVTMYFEGKKQPIDDVIKKLQAHIFFTDNSLRALLIDYQPQDTKEVIDILHTDYPDVVQIEDDYYCDLNSMVEQVAKKYHRTKVTLKNRYLRGIRNYDELNKRSNQSITLSGKKYKTMKEMSRSMAKKYKKKESKIYSTYRNHRPKTELELIQLVKD